MGLIEDLFEKSQKEIDFQRNTRFDKKTLIDMVENEGFEVIRFGTYFLKPFTYEQMETMLREGIIDEQVVQGLEKMTKHLPEMGCEMFADVRRK